MSRKYFLIGLFLLVSILWLMVWQMPDRRTHLIFCDVGQGDAILLTQGKTQVLIDGGPDEKVLDCLAKNLPFWDRTLEVVALTHPEADHLTGLISVLEKYRVKYFLTGPGENDSDVSTALAFKLQTQNLKPIRLTAGSFIKVGGEVLKVLWPPKGRFGQLNELSLVLLWQSESGSALLMGDADSKIQDDLLLLEEIPRVDLLKFPHHGSKTGLREDFLAAVKPKEAVISVGKNSFGQPAIEALDLLKKYKVKIHRTDQEGEIEYTFPPSGNLGSRSSFSGSANSLR